MNSSAPARAKISIIFSALMTMFLLDIAAPDAADSQRDEYTNRALKIISQETGEQEESLSIAHTTTRSANSTLLRIKVSDKDGIFHVVSFDSEGLYVSPSVSESIVAGLYEGRFVGKMERGLSETLSHSRPNDTVRAIYWIADPQARSPDVEDRSERGLAADLTATAARVATLISPVVSRLRSTGHRILYKSQYATVVVAAGTRDAIYNMQKDERIDAIYKGGNYVPFLNISKNVVQADVLHARGQKGIGRRVGVVEPGRIGSHPNLPTLPVYFKRCGSTSSSVKKHKTAVAGVLRSTHATYSGMSPSVTLIDGVAAGYTEEQLVAATDCVISNGARIINYSFGDQTSLSYDFLARYVDELAKRSVLIVAAVGNDCTLPVASPALAFNALAVGSFADKNTTGYADDREGCDSSIPAAPKQRGHAYIDPPSPHSDREEPDVVAPGRLIHTTTPDGGFSDYSGTSFSAPHVAAGIAAAFPLTEIEVPEELRAFIMASARHNVEGASRLSERDGAGAIMLAAASRSSHEDVFASFPTQYSRYDWRFDAVAGERVRVAIAWRHRHPTGKTLIQPSMDLDLTVLDPAANKLAFSASFDNNYEIVDFRAPVSGRYTARITNPRRPPGGDWSTTVGIAVSRRNS